MFDFSGKTVLVTGGAQGIGKETVKGVVEGGGHAVILDINEEVGKATAAEVGNCSFYKIDLGSSENIRAVMAQVLADFDRVDVLINVGGVISKAPFEEISDAEWERTLRINLTGTFTTCSAIYPYFKEKKGGRIVNVSSVAGKIGGGLLGTAAYASSKAGVNGLTKAIAKEGGNAVPAGSILSIMGLGIKQGDTVVINVEGDNAEAVADNLANILVNAE